MEKYIYGTHCNDNFNEGASLMHACYEVIAAVLPDSFEGSPAAVIRLSASTKRTVSGSSKSDTAETRSRQGRQHPVQHNKND